MLKTKKNSSNAAKSFRKHDFILGVRLDSTPITELLEEIQEKLQFYDRVRSQKRSFYIVTPNPEIILASQSDSELLEALNNSSFSIPDGEGLRLTGGNLNIIKGRKLFIQLLELAERKKFKVYLLGSGPFVIERALERIKKEFPHINAKGNCGWKLDNNANPISEVDSKLEIDIVNEINKFKPDLLFVAYGAPKQEKWIYREVKSQRLKVKGIMAVGGSLDYFSGAVKGVPKLFEDLRVEWLWRLVQEPRRIGRIFNAVIVFPLVLLYRKVFVR